MEPAVKTEEAFQLADRVNRISVSPTMAVLQEAEQYKAKGVDVGRLRPGRAGFSDPGSHQARRHQGARRKPHEVHGNAGHRAAAPGHLRLARRRIWARRISRPSALSRWAASTPFSTRCVR